MKRSYDDDNGIKRFISNYGDNSSQQQSSSSKDLLYGSPLQYFNGTVIQQQPQQQQTSLNKDQQQFKYSSLTMYPPPSIEQGPTYYNSYYNNSNWRFPNSTSNTQIGVTPFTYDPSQPPPPIPKLNKPESPKPPPLPPLPPGDPPYFSSSSLAVKNALSINSIQQQSAENQSQQTQQPPPPPYSQIDTSHNTSLSHLHHPQNISNAPRRPPPALLTRPSATIPPFRGGMPGSPNMVRSERPLMKRVGGQYSFKKGKPTFNKSPMQNSVSGISGSGGSGTIGTLQMNGQKKIMNKSQSNSRNNSNNDADDDGDDSLSHIQVNKKAKRKPMSTRYPRKIEWDRGDALKALALEKEYNKLQRNSMLILKFPDPELNKNIVKEYSPYIESVHFQQPSTPRYCFVQLKEGVDIEKVREELCQIPFGVGKIVAERKRMHSEEDDTVNPEDIDPYTLYIGNLPTTITVKTVKEHFPNSRRIDIGYAQRMRYTRYAFIRYETVEDAMEAYRNTFNLLIESRSLIVRFRRQKGNVGLPGESRPSNPKKDTQATNQQNKKQTTITNDATNQPDPDDINISSINVNNENNESEDDVCYVSGEPGRFIEDSKENVLEISRELAKQREKSNSYYENVNVNQSIKQEPVDMEDEEEQDDDIRNVSPTNVKEEPFDDDELLRQADSYEAFYSDLEHDCEEVDDPPDARNNDDDDDVIEQKPDVRSLPVPFPIFVDNVRQDKQQQQQQGKQQEPQPQPQQQPSTLFNPITTNFSSDFVFPITSSNNDDIINNLTNKKDTNHEKTKASSLLLSLTTRNNRDDLDDLFDRMNSESGDFNF